MRHFAAAVLGAILAPALLYVLGRATAAAAISWSDNPVTLTPKGLAATGILVITGVGFAVLFRGPPVTAFVVGLGFLTLNVMDMLVVPASAVLPSSAGIVSIRWLGTPTLLDQNIIAMLGVALVISALLPGRGRDERAGAGHDEEYWSGVKHAVEWDDLEHLRQDRADEAGRHRTSRLPADEIG